MAPFRALRLGDDDKDDGGDDDMEAAEEEEDVGSKAGSFLSCAANRLDMALGLDDVMWTLGILFDVSDDIEDVYPALW